LNDDDIEEDDVAADGGDDGEDGRIRQILRMNNPVDDAPPNAKNAAKNCRTYNPKTVIPTQEWKEYKLAIYVGGPLWDRKTAISPIDIDNKATLHDMACNVLRSARVQYEEEAEEEE